MKPLNRSWAAIAAAIAVAAGIPSAIDSDEWGLPAKRIATALAANDAPHVHEEASRAQILEQQLRQIVATAELPPRWPRQTFGTPPNDGALETHVARQRVLANFLIVICAPSYG